MSKMVQIRNMPEDLHRSLKVRAVAEGLSLSDYLIRELQRAMQYPSVEQIRRRLALRRPADKPTSTVEWVREERERR
jgi:plasmid stability protein